LGPIISFIGVTGFISGLIVVFIDNGIFYIFRHHFITGLLVAILIMITYTVSRKIKVRDALRRTTHFISGIILIFLYFIQTLLGIGILF